MRPPLSVSMEDATELINVSGARCSYCGSVPHFTTNRNGYWVLVCPECGALTKSHSLPHKCILRGHTASVINYRRDRRAYEI